MRALSVLSVVAVATALVIPDQQTLESLSLESPEPVPHPFWDHVIDPESIWEDLEEKFTKAAKCAKHKLDEAVDAVQETAVTYGYGFEDAFAGDAWLDTADYDQDPNDKPPHHGPPHHGPPHHGPPHGGPPKKNPHHPPPPHHGPPNQTVYELISKSKHTTKLAKAIDEFPDLVELLNGTAANYTLFAPTDRAFEKIPKHAPKPPKEFLKKLLTYHISPHFYPVGRLLVSRTVPTALEAEAIGGNPQRLTTNIGLRGLTINFYSRVVAANIFATNGVIYGIDSILLPPPKAVDILSALPSEFSTLDLALVKTGLYSVFNDTSIHEGGTLFAPSNFAFKRLGPKINAFLFSRFGTKFLKALLLYHTVDNITLYSDAIYESSAQDHHSHHHIPHGLVHFDLPSALHGRNLSVAVAHYGRLVTIRINHVTKVSVLDGIAKDGVIHVVPQVLLPSKKPGTRGVATDDMSLEEFQERLAPFVEEDDSENEMDMDMDMDIELEL